MSEVEKIYKQLTIGVKRSPRNNKTNNVEENSDSKLRIRVLPDSQEPSAKKPCVDANNEAGSGKQNGIEILAGAKLAFSGVNRKARAANRHNTDADLKRMHKEKIQHIRKLNRIYTWGDEIADPIIEFSDLNLPSQLIENLRESNIVEPSAIQMQSMPIMLAKRDLLASAPTGSGKTLAFAAPLIDTCVKLGEKALAMEKELNWPVAIVLEPTRVLAKQACQHVEQFAKGLPVKCSFLDGEIDANCNILVSTPNKLIFALEAIGESARQKLLKRLRWLIVDESDRIFDNTEGDNSFRLQLEKIMRYCDGPKTRRAFFSATFSYGVEEWCSTNLKRVAMVCIGARNSANSAVEQKLVFAGWEQGKVATLKTLIQLELDPPALVFVQSKDRAKQLFVELKATFKKLTIEMISSEIPNKKCDEIIAAFRVDKVQLLVCTEVMGRGLDFSNVNLVVNFDLPTSIVSYIHRVGRTGRAGRKGRAITYFTVSDMEFVRPIATVIQQAGFPVAEYLLKLKKVTKGDREKLRKHAPKRKRIARDPKWKRLVPKFAKNKGKLTKSRKEIGKNKKSKSSKVVGSAENCKMN